MANLEILIIDDDPHVREGLVEVLDASGHKVTEAGSASKGRALIADKGDVFDVVLLDLWLPEESGLDVLKDVRTSDPALPVIVMSGGGPGRSLEQAVAIADVHGASSVLIKPFQNQELLSAIAEAAK